MLLGYLAPETMLPATSVIAAVLGALLLLWQRLMNSLRAGLRWCGLSRQSDDAEP